jgi:hypothetical protein
MPEHSLSIDIEAGQFEEPDLQTRPLKKIKNGEKNSCPTFLSK